MKKIFLVLFSVFCFASMLYAADKIEKQIPPKAAFEDASKRTTIVVLLSEDPKKVLQLKKKKDDLVFYQEDVQYFNQQLKLAVEKYWKFTEKVEFHTMAEVKKMIVGKKAKDYLLLQWLEQTDKPLPSPNPKVEIEIGLPFKKLSNNERWGCFELRLAEMLMPGKPELFSIRTNLIAPLYLDDAYSMMILQYELNNRLQGLKEGDVKKNIAANAKMLSTKTLLIDKKDIDQNKFGDGRVDKSFYPYETQIDNADSIFVKLQQANLDYAVLKIIPNDNNELVHYFISCEDAVFCNVYVSKYDAKLKRKQRINADVLKGYTKSIK